MSAILVASLPPHECHFDQNSLAYFHDDNGQRCEIITGDVYITGYKDTRQLKVLVWVKEIHGSVTIRSNGFTAMNFLYRLQKINTKTSPALQITFNPNLKHIDLPLLTKIEHNGVTSPLIVIGNNGGYRMDEGLRRHLTKHFKGDQLRLQYTAEKTNKLKEIIKEINAWINEYVKRNYNIPAVYGWLVGTLVSLFFLLHFFFLLDEYRTMARMSNYWPNLLQPVQRTYREEYDRLASAYNDHQLSLDQPQNLLPLNLTNEELLSEETIELYEKLVRREYKRPPGEQPPPEEQLSDEADSIFVESYLQEEEKPEQQEGEEDSYSEEEENQPQLSEQEGSRGYSKSTGFGDDSRQTRLAVSPGKGV